MKKLSCAVFVWGALFVLLSQGVAFAAFNSESTGADGALVVSTSQQLQVPESGVFNFTTVTIEPGATLTFKKNEQNLPVTILASGDVVIAGTISLNGQDANSILPGEGGPGGFDGGVGGVVRDKGKRGEGPGGGVGGSPASNSYGGGAGEGGAFKVSGGNGMTYHSGAPGGAGSVAYGNERIIPLLGGSGGGGGGGTTDDVAGGGGGGGGAILIATSGTLDVSGGVYANGGRGANGQNYNYYSYGRSGGGGGGGGGAGGAIRIVANHFSGNGIMSAMGGKGGITKSYGSDLVGGTGSAGRIRLEYVTTNRTTGTTPPMSLGYALSVTPPDMPTLSIVSIAGVNSPGTPKGDFNAPDIVLPYGATNPVAVVVSAVNVPADAVVTVTSNPAVGSSASASAPLNGTNTSSSASVDLDISMAYPCVLTASVTYELSAALGGPFTYDGELIARVRVESSLGGQSFVTYITENGREIPVAI
jgi:hypothetical protein